MSKHHIGHFQKVLFIIILLSVSCTKNYEDKNVDPDAITEVGPNELAFLFTRAETQSLFATSYQTAQNLSADQYAQYFACVATSFNSDRYVMRPDWFNAAWTSVYGGAVPQLLTIFENTEASSAEYALGSILWVFAFHRLTDYWGPIPYFSVGEIANTVPYDAQEEIYDDFFIRLDEAVSVLRDKVNETPYGSSDIIYGGDVNKWIKLANTLRLRLAIRISNIDPVRARSEGEAAYQAGVFEQSPDDDALLQRSITGNDINQLSVMSDWNEFRMSATMESILKGYNDPRISEYFLPATASGTYEGLRNGLRASQLTNPANTANANSHVGSRWASPNAGGISSYLTTSQNVMCTAEAYFLRAEGALLGWDMGGSVQELYEDGIRNSMIQWNISDPAAVTEYVNSQAIPIAPDDFLNSPAVSSVPVLFDAANPDIQREQIAIQKWLAVFPDGCEAWADNRRSSAFKLYPVANSDNPDLPDPNAEYIRRLTFLLQEQQANAGGVASGEALLNGRDAITTPLWWDVHP